MEQQDERKIPPADLWDLKVAEGMSEDEATAYVAKVHGPPPQSIPAVRPDATMALQRERPDASGDWEAIPEGLKKTAVATAMSIPINRAVGVAAKGAARYFPAMKAGAREIAKDIPVLRRLGKASDAANRIRKALPQTAPVRGSIAPRTLEDALGLTPESLGLIDDAAVQGKRVGDVVRNTSPFKQQGAPKARFDYFAERMAQRAAKEAEGVAAPTLEELLALSGQHIKKGGTMDDLIRMNPGRRPR